MPKPEIFRSAILSDDGQYRYRLDRWWADMDDGVTKRPTVCFVMLNPSTADADVDDPTIRRCIGFARSWGYGRLIVVNQFGYRATEPGNLLRHGWGGGDVYGPDNARHMDGAFVDASLVICAWGASEATGGRRGFPFTNIPMVAGKRGCKVKALGLTKDGHPRHPLYMPKDSIPIPYPTRLVDIPELQ